MGRYKSEVEHYEPILIPEFNTPITGLTNEQVMARMKNGYDNIPVEPPSKSTWQIIRKNLFTYFNIVFSILAICVITVGSWRNLTFMPVVIINTLICIIQEIKAKKTMDNLNIISTPRSTVVRDGVRKTVEVENTVRDDIVVFSQGNQIFADALVVSGDCQVNEALMTGEADEIKKTAGDRLMSGSFVVSGSVYARLTHVGENSYISRLTLESKKKSKYKESEIMGSLSNLVRGIGIVILPLGIIMAVKEIIWLGRDLEAGIVSTVGALVGMIPEGLYLLTSLALTAAVIRLGRRRTLVHDMDCIETLARVDTLCVDKTGTITENKMIVDDIYIIAKESFNEDDVRIIMSDYVSAMKDDNDTMVALRRYFTDGSTQVASEVLPFTSVKKYGGVAFYEGVTFILGAPDIILGNRYNLYSEKIDYYSNKGCRVLLLAMYDGNLSDDELDSSIYPISLILLSNKIRKNALETFEYFRDQGVNIKVISGDNPLTVSEVSKRAGIENADKYIDARTLDSDRKIRQATREYTVFGRVTPEQKRKLVRAMKADNHTVAMTGDGINDVLALKEADCSIAMASGSEVASQVSNIVLLNSDFASLPSVIMEGRQVINNIERSAVLFLVKNIFSFLMAIITLIFTLPYPLTPAQLSLINVVTIGIPSALLTLEPNNKMVKGNFLRNVITRALPGGISNVVLIVGVMMFYVAFELPTDEMSTISAIILAVVGFLVLHYICKPYNRYKRILVAGMIIIFILSLVFFMDFFTLTSLSTQSILVLIVFALLANQTIYLLTKLFKKIEEIVVFIYRKIRFR